MPGRLLLLSFFFLSIRKNVYIPQVSSSDIQVLISCIISINHMSIEVNQKYLRRINLLHIWRKKKQKQLSCIGPPGAELAEIRINTVTAWNSDNWSIYELVNLQPWVWGRLLIIHTEIRSGNLKFIYQQLHSPRNPVTIQRLVQNLSSARSVIENVSSCWKGLSEKCTPVFKAVRGRCWAQGWSCRARDSAWHVQPWSGARADEGRHQEVSDTLSGCCGPQNLAAHWGIHTMLCLLLSLKMHVCTYEHEILGEPEKLEVNLNITL